MLTPWQDRLGGGGFLTGTRIATLDEAGSVAECAVEDLRPGDRVVTLSDPEFPSRPVRQVIRLHLDLAGHPRRAALAPVRLRADALGAGVPRRDLMLAQEQLLWFAAAEAGRPVLAPAGLLLNGDSIAREAAPDVLIRYGLELEAHDVVLAEGAPVGSLLPAGLGRDGLCGRLLGPSAEAMALRTALSLGTAIAGEPALPSPVPEPEVVVDGIVDDHGRPLRLFAGNEEIPMHRASTEERLQFALPTGCGPIQLVSTPHPSPAPLDTRLLGVCVTGVELDGAMLELDGVEIGKGFHPAEGEAPRRWRWTDGRAWLVLPHSRKRRRLILRINDWHRHLPPATPR